MKQGSNDHCSLAPPILRKLIGRVNSVLCREVLSPFLTTTTPILPFDNGTTRSIALDASFAPQTTTNGICNNGHEVFGAFVNGFGVYSGRDAADKFFGGTIDGGFINANGDDVFMNGHHNNGAYPCS